MSHKPRKLSTKIKSVRETAFQRAIFAEEQSNIQGGSVHWIDAELPVGKSVRPRDCCIDLLGIDEKGQYVICELKFGSKRTTKNSLDYACKQLIAYVDALRSNIACFRLHDKTARARDIDVDKLLAPSVRLIVALNEQLYNKWQLYNKRKGKQRLKIRQRVECYTITVDVDEFLRQKGSRSEYIPKPPEGGFVWNRIYDA